MLDVIENYSIKQMFKKYLDNVGELGQKWKVIYISGIILLLTTIIYSTFLTAKAANQTPVGALEAVDTYGTVTGWAVDSDTASTSISVSLYLDGPSGSGPGATFLGNATANIPKSGVPYPGNHGFAFRLMGKYRNGLPHKIYAYGIDSSGNSSANTLLSGSPLDFTLPSSFVSISNGTLKASIDMGCGGVLVEISLNNGANYINNYDCGRQIQTAFYDGEGVYDGCAGCSGVWGWNPVQGGDQHNFGSLIVSQTATPDSIYTKTQPYQWYPDNKGGYPGGPILSDMYVEQTVTFVPNQSQALKVHYKATYFGTNTHANSTQEIPAFYLNLPYTRAVYYSGTNPWANDTLTTTTLLTMPPPWHPYYYNSEFWVDLVDSQDDGVALYFPGQHPYFDGFSASGAGGTYGFGTNYIHPFFTQTLTPGSVIEGDLYVVAGNYNAARSAIYSIKNSNPVVDYATPFGSIDNPGSGGVLAGNIDVNGWTFDNTSINRAEVLVDDQLAGIASYGSPRADVATVYPNAPTNVGFLYTLNTKNYTNGAHTIKLRVYDTNNLVSIFPRVDVQINNILPPPNLILSKTASAPILIRGSTGSFTLTVSNSGGIQTDGSTVTVSDTLSSSLIPTTANGSGWTCTVSGQIVTCTRSDVLNSGASYPAITINVNVASNASSSITNTGSVIGGGDTTSATGSVTVLVSSQTVSRANQRISIDANNVYSPDIVSQGGLRYLYYGGWMNAGQTHDNIYRAQCGNLGDNCTGIQTVLDANALGFNHLNDPTIVKMPGGYYIMYMTSLAAGLDGSVASNNKISYSTSWIDDGVNWSAPTLVISDAWLASATLGPTGEVELFGNETLVHGNVVRFKLGPSGTQPQQWEPLVFSNDQFYLNPDVEYRASIGTYQMLAERQGSTAIDYLTSTDGVYFNLAASGIVTSQSAGASFVRTPGQDSNTANWLYYAGTNNSNATENKIYFQTWQFQ